MKNGSSAQEPTSDSYESGWNVEGSASADSATGTDGETEAPYGGHKVIKTASMEIETKNFDGDLAHIQQKAGDLGGYVASLSVSGTKPEAYGDAGRWAEITLRVPQEQLEAFMEDARGVANVIYEKLGTDDITSEYIDTESRLQVYQTQYDRLLALLEKAEEMEDIISLENELARVTYEIEALTSSLQKWDDLVAFSTVSVSLYERNVYSAASGGRGSLGSRMKDGFMNTLQGIALFGENFAVGLVSALPALLLLGIIALVVVLIVRASVKKSRRKKNAAAQPEVLPPEEPKQ